MKSLTDLREETTSIGLVARACELYATRPVLGSRDFEIVRDPQSGERIRRYLPSFSAITFSAMWERIVALASGFKHSGMINPGDFVGLIGFASPDFAIADFASLHRAAISIPLQGNLPKGSLQHIIHEANISSLICSLEELESFSELMPLALSIKNLVVMDFCDQDDRQLNLLARIRKQLVEKIPQLRINTIQEVEKLGRKMGAVPWVAPPQGAETLVTICYTSGSTGTPKGAMFPERLWLTYLKSGSWLPEEASQIPRIMVSYAPLSHMMGRLGVLTAILYGGANYFTLKSDISTLFEDIRLVRPTIMVFVPRISEMTYQHFQTEVLRRGGGISEEEEIKSEMRRTFLGDRISLINTGSAPTSPEVSNFLRECFQIPVIDSYGLTECGSVSFDDRVNRNVISDYKLIDAPELGYRTSDAPFPRGELAVKSILSIPGYFKNPGATQNLFDEQGYLKTGDIVEQRGPDHVVWIDRKNNVMKLSQGEFVALWQIESLFESASPFIQHIYLYANPHREFLVAVVVPDEQALRARFIEFHPNEVKQLLRSEIDRIAKESELRAFEIPRQFLIEWEPFTQKNGLLNVLNKLARPKLKEKYGERLEQLYLDSEQRRFESIAELAQMDRGLSIQEKVKKAVQATLGLSDLDWDPSQSFRSLGGDSLAAATLAIHLEEIGISLPASAILNPAASIADIIKSPTGVSFESIHGVNPQRIRATDLGLEKFFKANELEVGHPVSLLHSEVKVTLLTGANGFLGRFLCLELLAQAEKTGGKVYCIIRGKDDRAAFERLRDVYKTDPALEKHFSQLAEKRLVVLAGDLARPQLGLSNANYDRLAREVDTVLHAGALVNHALTYRHLFEPNVFGTVEILRLALKHRPKRVNYISTIGIMDASNPIEGLLETEDVRTLWPERELSTDYASGYGNSKWASEVLIRNFYDQYHFPVNVFRPDMIMPSEVFRSQINVPDLLTRLLCSVIYTGIVPQSFYEANGQGSGDSLKPHFDGMPVGFIASAITRICCDVGQQKYSTYNISNPHWNDGISLDRIMDWVESGGYPLKRMNNYYEWYIQIREKLKVLSTKDEKRSQYSSLPILNQWEKPLPFSDGREVDATEFRKKVRQLKPAGVTDIPYLTENFIHKYLADMVDLELIGPPPHRKQRTRYAA